MSRSPPSLESNAGHSRSGEGRLSPIEGHEDGTSAPITEGFFLRGACPPRNSPCPVAADPPGLGSRRNSPSCWWRSSSRTHRWSCTRGPRSARGAALLDAPSPPSKRFACQSPDPSLMRTPHPLSSGTHRRRTFKPLEADHGGRNRPRGPRRAQPPFPGWARGRLEHRPRPVAPLLPLARRPFRLDPSASH